MRWQGIIVFGGRGEQVNVSIIACSRVTVQELPQTTGRTVDIGWLVYDT